jgi:Ca2+-binding RTX toxin-like protein
LGIDTLYVNYTSGDIKTDGKLIRFDGTSGFSNFENLVGSAFSELIFGDSQDNRIDGGLGNDYIFGRDGNDILIGGDGLNFIFGGYGHNIIDGTNSNNLNNNSVAAYDSSDGLLINLNLEKGNATLASPGLSIAALVDDYINISSVRTGDGNDRITGNDQDNMFWGGGGNDSVFGGGGNDTIDGGSGFDRLDGGLGTDIFVFNKLFSSSSATTEVDTILDFGFGGRDKIDLRSYGSLDSDKLQIVNTTEKTNIFVHDRGFTQTIVVEGPSAGSLSLDDFILAGYSDQQTQRFDNSVFSIFSF